MDRLQEAMNNTPAVNEKYAKKPWALVETFRTFRIHRGIWLKVESGETKEEAHARMAAYDSTGIDVYITVLRSLLSMGMEIPLGNDFSKEEKAVFEVLHKDFGYDQVQDWKIKRHLHNQISSIPAGDKIIDFSLIWLFDSKFLGSNNFQLFDSTQYWLFKNNKWHLSTESHDGQIQEYIQSTMRTHSIRCSNDYPIADAIWKSYLLVYTRIHQNPFGNGQGPQGAGTPHPLEHTLPAWERFQKGSEGVERE